MFTFLGIGGILVFVPLGIWALHKFQSSDDEPWVALVIMAVVFSLFSVAAIACGLNGWVAPLPKLLGV